MIPSNLFKSATEIKTSIIFKDIICNKIKFQMNIPNYLTKVTLHSMSHLNCVTEILYAFFGSYYPS